jgi:hypothetical protein
VEEAKAVRDALHVFNARFELQRVDNRADKRYGIATSEQWEKLKAIYKQQRLIDGSVPATDFYTSALIDQINRFDMEAVIRQAKGYKF